MAKRDWTRKFNPLILVIVAVLAVIAVVNAIRIGVGEDKKPAPETVAVAASSDYPLAVTFLDVGQGDAIVVRCEDTVLMIDGGEREEADTVNRFLEARGIGNIDCYIASHPHSDHVGAAAGIFGRMNVKSVMLTEFSEINTPTTEAWERFLTAVDNENCTVLFAKAGESYTFGKLELTVVAPVEETADYNDMSIVLLMTYGKNRFLFTGDAGKASEQLILDAGYDVDADVIKLGHHGSSSSTSPAFFEAVSPRLAVISCGRNNDFGHPHRETLAMLKESGIPYYRTDLSGNITVYGDGKDIYVKE